MVNLILNDENEKVPIKKRQKKKLELTGLTRNSSHETEITL
jgi:hypothetical protein